MDKWWEIVGTDGEPTRWDAQSDPAEQKVIAFFADEGKAVDMSKGDPESKVVAHDLYELPKWIADNQRNGATHVVVNPDLVASNPAVEIGEFLSSIRFQVSAGIVNALKTTANQIVTGIIPRWENAAELLRDAADGLVPIALAIATLEGCQLAAREHEKAFRDAKRRLQSAIHRKGK